MTKYETNTKFNPQKIEFSRALSLNTSTKNFSMLVEVKEQERKLKAIYYPETGIRLVIDSRIPKPFEIKHNIAYYYLSRLLGWNIAIQTIPYSLDKDDQGALSPFYDDLEIKPDYFFKSLKPNDYWMKLAILDYLAGLIDRTYNDILFLSNGEIKVTDNGLSFVQGVDFTYQISIIRQALYNIEIPHKILKDIQVLNRKKLLTLQMHLYKSEDAIDSVLKRKHKLLVGKKII